MADPDLAVHLIEESRAGHDIFQVPLINPGVTNSSNPHRTTEQVRNDLMLHAGEMRVNTIPMMTPDEVSSEYANIFDKSLSLFDEQPKGSDIERLYSQKSPHLISHDQGLLETFGFNLKQWLHAAPVTHPRSQRNFLMDYSHLRDPMRRYLLSHSVNGMNVSIVDFAQRGGMSCFHRCMTDPGKPITPEEKRCVHFCGETLADVRKILATDWLNYSENLEHTQIPMLPAGNEMGDKETGTFNASNRSSQWNQQAREFTYDPQWINSD